ncbi:hypothetical protein ABEX25_27460 [Paenibacillus thiaminolyticus]|uniref:hypothetical protein n=1 Tax=Paenibacillus thiaminolyticus TaxID=49283 RepID=UPI003D2DC0AA
MLNDLDKWLDVPGNLNLFVGIVSSIGLLGVVLYSFFLTKIGKKDEYSLQIRLNVTNKMFITLTVLFTAFIFVVPNGLVYYKQLIIACFCITLLVGAISSAYYYFRDFKK